MTAPIASTPEGASLAGGGIGRFRAEFPAAPSAGDWDVVTGTGQSTAAAQTAQGTVLLINAGTTAAATFSMTSKAIFTAPARLSASIQLSQKIVNQSVYFELVAVDPITGVTDETRVVAWRFSGDDNTTATNGSVQTQNLGASRVALANQTVPSYVGAIGGTAPVVTFEIEHLLDEVWFHAKSTDSTASRTNSYVRTSTLPLSGAYKARIRVVNGTTPASGTSVWVGHVAVDTHAENPVEVVSSRGNQLGANALPVLVAGTPTVNVAANQLIAPQVNASSLAPTTVRIDALLAASQTIKGSANAKLYWAVLNNPSAAVAYVHFYNATAPTVGTTAPVLTIGVEAGKTAILPLSGAPYLNGSTALTVAATTTPTTAGSAAPATALTCSFGYL